MFLNLLRISELIHILKEFTDFMDDVEISNVDATIENLSMSVTDSTIELSLQISMILIFPPEVIIIK